MTEQELINYRKQFLDNHETFPEVLNLKAHGKYAAGEETSNRMAPDSISWIDYYRAFVNPSKEVFTCAACGKAISSNQDIVDMDDDVEEAFGGHIYVGRVKNSDIKFHIVPLCSKCNNSVYKIIRLASDCPAVEEVDPIILNDND